MDPLRLKEIAQDGDFRKVCQLEHESVSVSPDPSGQSRMQDHHMKKREHPWKSPIQRYRDKQLSKSIADDDDLEELSWKHRSKAYDLQRNDVTSKRVYHWSWKKTPVELYDDHNVKSHASTRAQQHLPLSKGESQHYTDRRPMNIETNSVIEVKDEDVTTPATILMDDDEFDSPCSLTTPSSIAQYDSSPAVVTPPKAILDQIAMDNNSETNSERPLKEGGKAHEGIEVTLKMFEINKKTFKNNERVPQDLKSIEVEREGERAFGKIQGFVEKKPEKRSDVKKLIEEHERLLVEAQGMFSMPPNIIDAANKSKEAGKNPMTKVDLHYDNYDKSMTFKENEHEQMSTISFPSSEEEKKIFIRVEEDLSPSTKINSGNSTTRDTKTTVEDQNVSGDLASDDIAIILDDDEHEGTFLGRASTLTTIVEETNTLEPSTPRLGSTQLTEIDSTHVTTRKTIHKLRGLSLNNDSPTRLEQDTTNNFKDFKEMRVMKLNKVTIAAALIDYNTILAEHDKNVADTRLQRAVKKHRQRHGFFTGTTPTHESLRTDAAVVIQAHCRGFLAIRMVRRKLVVARIFSATLIQAAWRSYDSRMNFIWHRGSAAMIQANWRSCVYRKQYESIRASAVLIQSVIRMVFQRNLYIKCQRSAIILQSQCRCYNCKKQFESLRSSTILVQSITRMFLCRSLYVGYQNSARVIQSKLRSYIGQKQYKSLLSSIILIQSTSRMHLSHLIYLESKKSARTIQCKLRSYIGQKNYKSLRSSTIMIQSFLRMYLIRHRYLECKSSARDIQTQWRSYSSQQKFKTMQLSTIKIQSFLRMYRIRCRYFRCQRSARDIQTQWRSYSRQQQFKSMQSSTIKIQSFVRMYFIRCRCLQCQSSARDIQAHWRSYNCQQQFKSMQSSTIKIQSFARMCLTRCRYLQWKSSARDIETQWRSYKCLRHYRLLRSSTIIVQSMVRMYQSRSMLIDNQRSATVVQTLWRSYMGQHHFKSLRSSTILIQSFVRMKFHRNSFIQLKNVATMIQAASRMSLCRAKYIECRRAATLLEATVRMYLIRAKYLKQNKSIILLQAAFRATICRSHYHECKMTVTKLQSLARMHLCHSKYIDTIGTIITLQAALRRSLYRARYLEYKIAATKLQTMSRMRLSHAKYLQQKVASTTLQGVMRMYLSRSNYIKSQKAATILQAEIRLYFRRIKYLKERRAAITLQSLGRMHNCRAQYLTCKVAALVVQAALREHQRQKDYATFETLREVQEKWRSSNYRDDYTTLLEIKKIPTSSRTSICKRNFVRYLSSIIIQKGWRKYTHRRASVSARSIQARWRAYILQKKLIVSMVSVARIQTTWRVFICQKKYSLSLKSATLLQAIWRRRLCQKSYILTKQSAICLQQKWRSTSSRTKYMAMLTSARLIQSRYRACICRKNLQATIRATRKLQSIWRSYCCKKEFLSRLLSATKIQKTFRGYACRKIYAIVLLNRAANKLQSLARMYFSRTKFIEYRSSRTIQTAVRMYLGRLKHFKLRNAVVLIQSVYRAHICRKNHVLSSDSMKMIQNHCIPSIDVEEEVKENDRSDEQKLFEDTMLMDKGVIFDYNDSDIHRNHEDDEENGTYLARSSILTTIVEERSPPNYSNSNLKSSEILIQSDQINVPTPPTVKRRKDSKSFVSQVLMQDKEPDVDIEVIQKEPIVRVKEQVRVEVKKDTLSSNNGSSRAWSKKASEERLMALAAKVASRRGSLNRNKFDIATRDPWQKKKELQKKSRPISLSKRMSELDKIAKMKRVSGDKWWNKKGTQNGYEVDVVENKVLVQYPNISGDRVAKKVREFDKDDSIVKKLFELDNHGDDISNNNDLPRNQLEDHKSKNQETEDINDVNSDTSKNIDEKEVTDFRWDLKVEAKALRDATNTEQSCGSEIFAKESALEEENCRFDENEADRDYRDTVFSWNGLSIVDDLADDINDFETDTENDDYSTSSEEIEKDHLDGVVGKVCITERILINDDSHWEEPTVLDEVQNGGHEHNQRKEDTAKSRASWKEQSIVNDLMDDIDVQMDELSDMEDNTDAGDHYSDEEYDEGSHEVSIFSRMNIFKFF